MAFLKVAFGPLFLCLVLSGFPSSSRPVVQRKPSQNYNDDDDDFSNFHALLTY